MPAFLLNVGKVVVTFIVSVTDNNDFVFDLGAFNRINQRFALILTFARLN
jgi:hypothetical protein